MEESTTLDPGSRTRALSPDAGGGSDRKRRRKVLSCYDCRRRKLQCDRAMPACGRCTKAGQAANCLYLDDPSEAPSRDLDSGSTANAVARSSGFVQSTRPSQPNGSAGDALARLEFQDARIKELEAALSRGGAGYEAGLTTRTTRLPPINDMSIRTADFNAPGHDKESVLLRGKSFKTKFHGSTHPLASTSHIHELHAFTRDTFENFPALRRIREDLHNLDKRAGCGSIKHEVTTNDDLKAFLPPKEETDKAVQTYLSNYGSIYHVIHLPSFWREYEGMWRDVPKARPQFIALVLAILAAEQCLNSTQPWLYTANSSSARERAVTLIQAIEDWLLQQSQKQVTATDFQVRVLLFFAKQVAARKFKRAWTEAGSLVRFCMGAGLHRNPDLIRKPTSLLDKELRRRVWAAATELDLQASFDRGMLATPWQLQSDCPLPSHIDDDDIDETAEKLPSCRAAADLTRVTYLVRAGESILLRSNLNTYLNNIRQTISFEEVKKHTEEIETQLKTLPELTGDNPQVPNALLRLSLWQYMLVLHDRHFHLAQTRFERDFSRMVLVETAAKIIDTHKSLTSNGCYALELLCCDQLRAAMATFHVSISIDPLADDALSKAYSATADRLVAEVIEMLHDKVIRFGCEQRQLWLVLAAKGSLQCRRDPSKRVIAMQEAVDKITQPYYKIMACQDDVPTQVSTTGPPTERETPNMADFSLKPSDGLAGLENDPVLLDMDEIAAWTFEDFTFNPADLASYPSLGYQGQIT